MRYVLNCGTEVDVTSGKGMTPLHYAAKAGHENVCALLVDRGAGIEEKDEDGSTPLHFAALGGHVSVCALLLDRSA